MGKVYSKNEIIKIMKEAKSDIKNFYKKEFVNYLGVTSDTKEYYTEIIAEWLLDNFYLFDTIKMISRESSYKVDSHNGIIKDEKSNREEEKIAMELFDYSQNKGVTFDIIGKIIDYQTPLKNVQKDDVGKIDLLAYNEKEKTLKILELKKPDSKETMLRCVLEAYTYLKIVDKDKLLKDFGLLKDTILKTCPFVFVEGEQYKEIQEDREHLKDLIEKLGIEVIYLEEKNEEYSIKK
ncbi:hypothetical protein HMPREF2085_00005 [Fusobacterium nucleatum 13_3C]|uniref:Uncharacterized protein n=1 Tax=Fusobacterium nucleatum 13_3C TaxID=1357398 RepID=X7SEM3_FUSNU|nr:hypothetical protein [Fusobacterium nucleatum]ETZ31272.1 hypothetical protein HMPREF2085_00005 [Fusobacterium nucleatum 13_3C]